MDQESDETFFGLDGGGVIDFPAGILGMSHAELKTLDCQIGSLSQVFRGDRKKRNMRYEGRMVAEALSKWQTDKVHTSGILASNSDLSDAMSGRAKDASSIC